MNVQLAGADCRAVVCLHGHFLLIFRTVVSHQNCGFAPGGNLYGAGYPAAVGPDHGYGIAHGKGIGFNIHRHETVQRKNSYSAVRHHGIGHIGSGFCVDDLHPAGNAGPDDRTYFVSFCIGNLIVQIFDGGLQLCHGSTHSTHIHRCDQIANLHLVTVADQNLRQLHPCGNGDSFRVHILQRSAAGYHGADGAGFHFIGKNVQVPGGKLFPDPPLQNCHAQNQNESQNHHDADDGADDSSAFLLFVLSQRFKKGIVLCVRKRHLFVWLFFHAHHDSFIHRENPNDRFLNPE